MKLTYSIAVLTFVVLTLAANAFSQVEPPHPDPMPPKAPVQYIEPPYKKGSLEAELVRLDRAWTSAELKGDKKSVTAMLAEDFVGTTQLGELQNKQQYIDGVTANSDMVHSDDYKIRTDDQNRERRAKYCQRRVDIDFAESRTCVGNRKEAAAD